MAYRKLGRTNKHRRSMLANLTKEVINNGKIETTETRAKEVRKFVDKMITYGKKGDLVSRRKAYAFLHNDKDCVKKIFDELAEEEIQTFKRGNYEIVEKESFKKIALDKDVIKEIISSDDIQKILEEIESLEQDKNIKI